MGEGIQLVNGSWDGRVIEDSGAVEIHMTIATAWKGNRPAVGASTGVAIYEPTINRAKAFWLENRWDGIVEEIIENQ